MGNIVEAKFMEPNPTGRAKAAVGVPLALLEPGELEAVLSHQVSSNIPNRMWLVGPDRRVLGMVDPNDFDSARENQSWVEAASARILDCGAHAIVLESSYSGGVDKEAFLRRSLPQGILQRLFPSSVESAAA